MDTGLNGKVALITGASSGIGRATASLFAAEGARVVCTYNTDKDAARDAETEIRRATGKPGQASSDVLIEKLDMADASGISALVKKINRKWGGVDILVNAAATYGRTDFDFETGNLKRWNDTLTIDLTGAYIITKAVFPNMKKKGWGRIVYLSSTAAAIGLENAAHYAAAKGGLIGLTRGLARDLAQYGILVNALAPARVVTPKQLKTISQDALKAESAFVPAGRLANVDDVARTILFFGSGWNTFVNGEIVVVDGGGRLRKPLEGK